MTSQPSTQVHQPLLNPTTLHASMDHHPLVVSPQASLKDAVLLMSRGQEDEATVDALQCSSYVLVQKQRQLMGLLTERDIVRLSATEADFSQVSVAEVMDPMPLTLYESDLEDVLTPLSILQSRGIRHLPITTPTGDVVGVITTESIRKVLEPTMLLKLRHVSEVMTPTVVTALPTATIQHLAQQMVIHQMSCVVIVQAHSQSGRMPPVGIVTERDIVQFQALNLNLRTTLAEAVMSQPLMCLNLDDTLWIAHQMMQRMQVRRLVVMEQQGGLAGMLTQASILDTLNVPEAHHTAEILHQQVEQLQDQRIRSLQHQKLNLEKQVEADAATLYSCQERFRAMFEQAVVGIAHVDLQGQILLANQRLCEIVGKEQVCQCHMDNVLQINDGAGNWRTALQSRESDSLQTEHQYQHPQGHTVWLDLTLSLATTSTGAPDYFIVILQDISDRKQAELERHQLNQELEARVAMGISAFRASEQQFRMLFNAAPDALFVINLQGVIRRVNQATIVQSGYTSSELLGSSITTYFRNTDHADCDTYLAQLIAQGSHRQRMELIRKDGSFLVVDCSCTIVTDPASRDPYILMVQRDVSERVQAETALRESEQRFQQMADCAPVLLWMSGLDKKCTFFNQQWLEFTGQTMTHELGKGWTEGIHPEDRQQALDICAAAFDAREPFCMEYRLRRHDGVYRWLIDIGTPRFLPNGEFIGYIGSCVDITERKILEDKVRSSEAQIRAVFDGMTDIVFVFDSQTEQINAIPPSLVSPDMVETINQTAEVLLLDNEQAQAFHDHIHQALHHQETVTFEYQLPSDTLPTWYFASITPLSATSVIWVAHDITDRKYMEQELFQEKELAQVTLQSIGDAVITTDAQGKIRHLNAVAEKLTGWSCLAAKDHPVHDVFNVVHETTRHPEVQLINSVLTTGEIAISEHQALLLARDGAEYAVDHSAAPIRDRNAHILGIVLVFRDVSHSRQLSQQMTWQASHDSLTGLVNRYQFEQMLQKALRSAHRDQLQHVLCYLDLDQFKIVNDTCGHAAGDELLQQVAELFKQTIRSTDVIARLGGDEFGLLLHQCSMDRAQVIAEQLRQRLQTFRFSWNQQTFSIGLSIGLVAIHYDSHNLSSLISAADSACYAAKARGRNRVHVYQLDDLELVQQRGTQRWSRRIKQALEENRFRLYGQAIVPANPDQSDIRQCCEVLLRMVDEQDQVVKAAAFIPAAERYNLMPEIDRWVISQFLVDHFSPPQIAPTGADQPLPYMINLSGASIGDEQFLQFLQEQFQRYPHAAPQICFEITETAAISNLNQAITFIHDLKQLGCKFALDDFGSGLSSFAYLKTLPVDYLKIDGHFIEDMNNDPATQAIVESINHIGHVMGLQTIAESVGDLSTRKKLQSMGIDYVQGYGIALPCSLTYT
ncbi:PAS domain S-box protein [Acaryochloris sp. IP29b_bin.148]|uniref:PAS domain S-box protein n=1 Tax=Acaryochloris sp. IP29b_bin.148 TaxID=2969218 RepID=UPI0026109470|nr:PAS domain S-box protein [Acaryochloris sp. IP29b_bin.148]